MTVFLRKALLVTLIMVAIVAIWVVLVKRWVASVAPGGDTLAQCLVKLPEPGRIEVFVQDGQEYVLLWGNWDAFPRFPSGPPMYVFDQTGRLVDWVADSGDSPSWLEKWPGLSGGRQITREEMMRWPGAQ